LLLLMAMPFAAHAQNTENPAPENAVTKKAKGIVFIGDSFKEALRQAQLQNKYIFVDAYASWCGPCKLLKATSFRNKKTAVYFNDNFINVSIDMEKGEGPELAMEWGIQAYPTLIIFDPSGKAISGTVGYMSGADLVRFGKQALAQSAN